MNLLSKIIKNGEIIGARISDGDLNYSVFLDALKTRRVFTALLENGWQLDALPYGFSKHGTSINNLPAEEFSSLPQQEKDDFYMTDDDLLTDSELLSHIKHKPALGSGWKDPAYKLISTRDELKAFLMNQSNTVFRANDPATYMPLNSICNPDVLFSPEEYVDETNQHYVSAIERRRVLSFAAYRELLEVFRGLGLQNNFTALDFQKMYFSWGICGINSDSLTQITETRLTSLGQYVSSDDLGVLTHKHTSNCLIDRYGNLMPKLEPGWKRSSKFDPSVLLENEVKLIPIEKSTNVQVEKWACDGMTVEFDSMTMHLFIKSSNSIRKTMTMLVRYPFAFENIPVDLWNIWEPNNLKKISNRMFADALTDKLIRKTAIDSDASTLKVLTSIGLTEANAMDYIASVMAGVAPMDVASHTVDNDEASKMKMIKAGISAYMAGSESVEDFVDKMRNNPLEKVDTSSNSLEQIDEFVSSVRESEINLDDIQSGATLDNSRSRSILANYFIAALELMGATEASLLEQVDGFEQEEGKSFTELRIFGENNIFIKHDLSRGDMKVNGYNKDLVDYTVRAAETADYWIHVTSALFETTHEAPRRHMGITYLCYNHCRVSRRGLTLQHPELENYITEIIRDAIHDLPTQIEKDRVEAQMPRYVARMLFTMYEAKTNSIQMPAPLGGRTVIISDAMMNYVHKQGVIFDKLESLLAICDNMTEDGKFIFYCENARLNPHLVIPMKGQVIPEYSFMHSWKNNDDLNVIRDWYAQGLIPSPSHEGFSRVYGARFGWNHVDKERALQNGNFLPNYREEYQRSPYSLERYFTTHMQTKAKWDSSDRNHQMPKPITLPEEMYPMSYEYTEVLTPCTPDTYLTTMTRTRTRNMTAELIGKDFPEIVGAVELVKGDDYMAPAISKFKTTLKLPLSVFTNANIDEIAELETRLSMKVKLVMKLGDYLIFEDGFSFNFFEIGGMDVTSYACAQIGDSFYFLDRDNYLYCREVPDGVIIK